MSFEHEYEIFPAIGFIVERYRGEIDIEGLFAAVKRMHADPAFDPSFDRLVDVMEAMTYEGLESLQRFALWLRRNEPGVEGRRAVASGNARLVAMVDLIKQALHGGRELNALSSVPEALAWLRIEYGPGDRFVRSPAPQEDRA